MRILTNKQVKNLLSFEDFMDEGKVKLVNMMREGIPIGGLAETIEMVSLIEEYELFTSYINSVIERKLSVKVFETNEKYFK